MKTFFLKLSILLINEILLKYQSGYLKKESLHQSLTQIGVNMKFLKTMGT